MLMVTANLLGRDAKVKSTRIIEDAVRRINEALPVDEIGEDLRRNVAEAVSERRSPG